MIRITCESADALNDRVRWFTGNSENDLKINIFLAAVELAVDVDVDADGVFKDPALAYAGTD